MNCKTHTFADGRRLLIVCLLVALPMAMCRLGMAIDEEGPFRLEKSDGQVKVLYEGKPFTTYHTRFGAKPILWPVIGPQGVEMTRSYPQNKEGKATERKDHIHHRSFWFTHGDVNGVSFWHEEGKNGITVHKEFVKLKGGENAVISSINDWEGPDGKKHCRDLRTFTFSVEKGKRYVDAVIKVTAEFGDVVFGDTKEGSFGVRTAGTMKVDSKLGGKILSSEGLEDAAAWGKPASWVDYTGPVDGKTVGIAILNHPSSYGYPSHWHVRNYGLFAANPFGLKAFKTGKDGTLKLKKGESFTLKYRVIFHSGTTEQAKIAEEFKKYSGK